MAEEVFRLPQSSYDELVKIIKAYGTMSDAASLSQVATTAAMHETIVSRNNAFLVSVGILEGGRAKKTTPKGQALAMALQHEIAEQVGLHWREIVLANEFLQKMVSAVSIRKGMEPSTLQAHIAYSAGQPKTQGVMTGAAAVIDILKVAALLTEHDGKLNAEPISISPRAEAAEPSAAGTLKPGASVPSPIPTIKMLPVRGQEGASITIQIQIQCSASEVQELGPKLRALLKELSRPTDSEESSQP